MLDPIKNDVSAVLGGSNTQAYAYHDPAGIAILRFSSLLMTYDTDPHWPNGFGVQRVNDRLTWLLVVFSTRTFLVGPASAKFNALLQLFGSEETVVAVGRIKF